MNKDLAQNPKSYSPRPPFPAQHQKKPGAEHLLDPKPRFWAPNYKGSEKLKGKVALVTGGDSGIGRSVCVLYAREGADIAFTFLPEEEKDAIETQKAVENEGANCIAIACDLTKYVNCENAVKQTVENFGHLDILVNNAAFQQHQPSPEELSIEQWDHTFKTNIYAYFYMVKAALSHLKEGAAIINCSSILGFKGSKGLIDYSSTKGAINAFTKSLAQSFVDRKIRVNCVAPGPVWTPLNPSDRPASEVAHFGEKWPMGRPAQPDEIAPAFVFFASSTDSSYVSGEILSILGGGSKS